MIPGDTKLIDLPDEMLLDVLILLEKWLMKPDRLDNIELMLSMRTTCKDEILRRMEKRKE